MEHPGPCELGAEVATAEADSRAGELAAATVVDPPGASQDKQPPLSLTVAARDKQDKQLPLSPAPGRGLSGSPKC